MVGRVPGGVRAEEQRVSHAWRHRGHTHLSAHTRKDARKRTNHHQAHTRARTRSITITHTQRLIRARHTLRGTDDIYARGIYITPILPVRVQHGTPCLCGCSHKALTGIPASAPVARLQSASQARPMVNCVSS